MRTAILLAGISIAKAINDNWVTPESVKFMAVVTAIAIGMDIIEWIKKVFFSN